MSHMSTLHLRCIEAGIDPNSVTVEEAIDLLMTKEITMLHDYDCLRCELPDEHIISVNHLDHNDILWPPIIDHCPHPCHHGNPHSTIIERRDGN